jgi:hypothetical protein
MENKLINKLEEERNKLSDDIVKGLYKKCMNEVYSKNKENTDESYVKLSDKEMEKVEYRTKAIELLKNEGVYARELFLDSKFYIYWGKDIKGKIKQERREMIAVITLFISLFCSFLALILTLFSRHF